MRGVQRRMHRAAHDGSTNPPPRLPAPNQLPGPLPDLPYFPGLLPDFPGLLPTFPRVLPYFPGLLAGPLPDSVPDWKGLNPEFPGWLPGKCPQRTQLHPSARPLRTRSDSPGCRVHRARAKVRLGIWGLRRQGVRSKARRHGGGGRREEGQLPP
ncbi:hypothetical protein T492DRAFT_928890, partial [Pavlovales sp. CCMP2436]